MNHIPFRRRLYIKNVPDAILAKESCIDQNSDTAPKITLKPQGKKI